MFEFIKSFFAEDVSNSDIINYYVYKMTNEELIFIFNKNLHLFYIELFNGDFYNENLSPELNDFFRKFKLIKSNSYIFSHAHIKIFEFIENMTIIGKDYLFGIDILVKNKKSSLIFSDGPFNEDEEDKFNIYNLLVSDLMIDKYEHLTSKEEIENAIKKELEDYGQ